MSKINELFQKVGDQPQDIKDEAKNGEERIVYDIDGNPIGKVKGSKLILDDEPSEVNYKRESLIEDDDVEDSVNG